MEINHTTEQISYALGWIVDLLNRRGVPYQIVGGLAAQAYGATRPLVDIDLYIPLDHPSAVDALEEMRPHLVREPLPHRSPAWDMIYLALEVDGVLIEIGDSSASPRFFNRIHQRWEDQVINYAAGQPAQLYGVDVLVMPRNELLRYKLMLDREVDNMDIDELS